MKFRLVFVLLLVLTASIPAALWGQADSRLPAAGSYGVSFSLPSGGGAGFGVRRMLSPSTNAGVEIQVGFTWLEGDDPGGAEGSRTSFGVGVTPDLRLYRRVSGPVVPFIEVEGRFSYQHASTDYWGVDGGAGVGLGVEWLPLEGMSISGSTGISASYRHHGGGPSSRDSFILGVFRSELTLNLYF